MMENGRKFRLLVLVPHRDARLPLRAWSARLFAAGTTGAWSFPWVVPLARLERPLSTEELKLIAHALRRCVNENGGAFTPGPPEICPLPVRWGNEDASVLGPVLRTAIPDDFLAPVEQAITSRFSPLVIGSALIISHSSFLTSHFPVPPEISFRAAALANMIYVEKDGAYFEWKIGPLHWLPKKIR